MVGAEVYSAEVKKTEVLMENFRRAIGEALQPSKEMHIHPCLQSKFLQRDCESNLSTPVSIRGFISCRMAVLSRSGKTAAAHSLNISSRHPVQSSTH